MKIAAAHVAPVYMNPLASAEKAASWITRAGGEGIDLVVFPEVFIPGFPYWINAFAPLAQLAANERYQDCSVEVAGPEIAIVQAAARAANVAVVIGISERSPGGRSCYNTSVVIDRDGALLGHHRKLKPTLAERMIWGDGDGSTLSVFQTAVGRVGALACWEHTMNLARQALAEQNIEIHAGLWPGLSTIAGFEEVADIQIEAMMRNHALTAQCFVACASSPVTAEIMDWIAREIGPTDMLGVGGGWTAIIHPFAMTLAGPVSGLEEQLVAAEIDLDARHGVKFWVDGTGHYSRPDVLSLNFDRTPRRTMYETSFSPVTDK
ncbi:carbon-nitrogen hydrolase family protein [Glacieibacterium sp.]|uniref:carbon-nitrogen hydrolase family protein n=1 Tax=Glacieibacterium sp. TaxID=2860237 RepID=UPI003B00AF68